MAPAYDLVVFGATGYTGERVAASIDALAKAGTWRLKWAVGGRSRAKLDALCAKRGLAPTGVVVADTDDAASLKAMAASSRVVMNCTGPYRFYGEPVVAACVAAGADYVDLCGEPEFIDRMQLKFGVPAVLAGVLVVHACAFDSVPADVGCLFTALQFAPPARCAHAMMYHTADWPAGVKGAAGHATTFFAAVHGFANVGATRRQRKELLAALEARVPGSTKEAPTVGPKLKVATGPTWVAKLAKYAFRFPGADVAVVRTSQRTLHSLGGSLAADGGKDGTKQFLLPQYGAAFCVTSTMSAWMVAATGALFNFLAARAWGRSLLLRFPQTLSAGAFSHEGPSEEMLAKSTFRTVFFGDGYSDGGAAGGAFDRRVTCSVSGPEPGYIATALMFGAMARTLLDDRAGLGLKGGVFTPGGLVGSGGAPAIRRLVERLGAVGVKFTVDEES